MSEVSLSLILPVHNEERKIAKTLQYLFSKAADLPKTEWIIVDTGSTDNTVLEAVQALHAAHQQGCVMQNGNSTIAAGLNTGLAHVHGVYVSFLFPQKLYQNCPAEYCRDAQRTHADLIFGCKTEESSRHAAKRLPGTGPKQSEYTLHVLKGELQLDLSAVVVRFHFLSENNICFSENCRFGYAEEFLLRCLLLANSVYQSPLLLQRDTGHELPAKDVICGAAVLQRIDALIRVADILHSSKSSSPELISFYQEEYIPKTILSCIDRLLQEGYHHNVIKLYLRRGGYDKMLLIGSHTDPALRGKIFQWKTLSLFYKPQKAQKGLSQTVGKKKH
ncbi:MAG: glycosyltransferase family 2 protein [Oscillospiraceae bacterium]|nr:glycosyltransferase family 2 protein [Oscillospiraceae bacterium]MDD3262075.1 glycosyltransferase family A protein [Oscillospiraceae bacterium]